MSTLPTTTFQLRDNEIVAAKGGKLLTLARRGVPETNITVTDNAGQVALRLEVTTLFGHAGASAGLTVGEARALAAALREVAAFIEAKQPEQQPQPVPMSDIVAGIVRG